MEEFSIINDAKEQFEIEIPELKLKLNNLQSENISLTDQVNFIIISI